MEANRTQITELDFDSIKNNLKNFLKSQSEFQDYDFEGSGLSVLLDILAYNTHYNAYYLNTVANEAFLDSAIIRDSVVSHAKSLGYTPYSKTSARSIVNMTVSVTDPTVNILELPRGTNFRSQIVDGVSYNFTTLNDYSATKANSSYLFENLPLYQGEIIEYNYVYSEQNNPKSIFTIPDENVDVKSLVVTVTTSSSNDSIEIFNLSTDILEIDGNEPVYFLQEGRNNKYEIYFGNGVIGKKLENGNIVTISYLVTEGITGNKISGFTLSSNITDEEIDFVDIDVISESSGGSERESIDEIKFSAKSQYSSQNRLITVGDYEYYVKTRYPIIESISVWGGEDENPPVYGKVFISLKPKNNYFISETEKEKIINNIIKPKSAISTDVVIRDPEFLYVKLINEIQYDSKKTILSEENLRNLIRTTILNYFDLYANKFNTTFALSKLHEEMDNSDPSIIGIQSQLKVEKRFSPLLNIRTNYNLNFNTPLFRGSTLNRISSTEFDVFDNFGTKRRSVIEEVPESFTGISRIEVENPGSGYTSIPKVTITGDGTGATATAKIVNGRLESVTIENRGVNYTRAFVRIEEGGGFGATSTAILDNRFGSLRTVYFDENAERQIINNNVGSINYDTGELTLNNLNILNVYSEDGFIRVTAQSEKNIVNSIKNNIVVIDSTDPSSIITTTIKV